MSAPTTNWFSKFSNAIRGVLISVRDQSSFRIHLPIAAAVLITAIVLQLPATRLMILVICIAGVFAAELFNSSLEELAKSITSEQDCRIRDSLDMAAGAVLIAALAAALIGSLVFGQHVYEWLTIQ